MDLLYLEIHGPFQRISSLTLFAGFLFFIWSAYERNPTSPADVQAVQSADNHRSISDLRTGANIM
jgi:hypothetical protein